MISSLARKDLRAYVALLASKGQTLDSTARDRLYAGAKALYSLLGRVDFFPIRDNVGSGTALYTFRGKTATLVGSPAWVSSGIQNSGSGSIVFTDFVWNPTAHTVLCGITQTNPGGLNQCVAAVGDAISTGNGVRFKAIEDGATLDCLLYAGVWGTYLRIPWSMSAKSCGYSYTPSRHRVYRDTAMGVNNAPTSLSGGASINRLSLMAFDDSNGRGQHFIGRIHFAIILPVELSQTQYEALVDIYTSTFGAGL